VYAVALFKTIIASAAAELPDFFLRPAEKSRKVISATIILLAIGTDTNPKR
jgi:hypothetical protein